MARLDRHNKNYNFKRRFNWNGLLIFINILLTLSVLYLQLRG